MSLWQGKVFSFYPLTGYILADIAGEPTDVPHLVPREAVLPCAPCARTKGRGMLSTWQSASKNAQATDPARESPAPRAALSHPASGGPSARGGRNDFPGKRPQQGLRRGRIRGKANKTRGWMVFEGPKTASNFFQLFLKTPLRATARCGIITASQRPD